MREQHVERIYLEQHDVMTALLIVLILLEQLEIIKEIVGEQILLALPGEVTVAHIEQTHLVLLEIIKEILGEQTLLALREAVMVQHVEPIYLATYVAIEPIENIGGKNIGADWIIAYFCF